MSCWIQSTVRFKIVRVARSQCLVSLYICYALLNVHDKNLLYGNYNMTCISKVLSGVATFMLIDLCMGVCTS